MNEPFQSMHTLRRYAKPAAIPVLALLLIAAVWPAQDQPLEAVQPADSADRRAAHNPANASIPLVRQPRPVDLQAALSHDPFSVPDLLREPVPIEEPAPSVVDTADLPETVERDLEQERLAREAQAAELRRLSVSTILIGPQGASAVVDGTIVRQGDTLRNGSQVVAIDSKGVVLRMMPPVR